jgi:ABC-type nitrate/sulfonate/bicarbonate transport system substrate-binding protein
VIALGWVANVEYADLWLGLDRGYFAAENIFLRYLPGGPNAPQPEVELAADEADIGEAEWLPLLDSIARGNDFVILGAGFPTLPAGIISLPKRPMRKPVDLVGGRFLFQGPTERSQLEALFKINRLPRNYTLVPVGFSPEALLNGAGDAYCCFVTNQPITLEGMGLKQGKDFLVTRLYDLGYQVPSTLIFVQRRTLETRRPMLVGYLRALLRARADNIRNPREAARLATDKYGADLGLDLEQQTRENELQIPLQVSPKTKLPFWIGPDDVSGPMYTAARATGRTNLPNPARLLDTSLLLEAYKGLGIPAFHVTGQTINEEARS